MQSHVHHVQTRSRLRVLQDSKILENFAIYCYVSFLRYYNSIRTSQVSVDGFKSMSVVCLRKVQKKCFCLQLLTPPLIKAPLKNVEICGGLGEGAEDDIEKVRRTSGKILTTHLLKPETEQQES